MTSCALYFYLPSVTAIDILRIASCRVCVRSLTTRTNARLSTQARRFAGQNKNATHPTFGSTAVEWQGGSAWRLVQVGPTATTWCMPRKFSTSGEAWPSRLKVSNLCSSTMSVYDSPSANTAGNSIQLDGHYFGVLLSTPCASTRARGCVMAVHLAPQGGFAGVTSETGYRLLQLLSSKPPSTQPLS